MYTVTFRTVNRSVNIKSGGIFNGCQLHILGSRRQSTRPSEIQSKYAQKLQQKAQE